MLMIIKTNDKEIDRKIITENTTVEEVKMVISNYEKNYKNVTIEYREIL